MARVSIIIPAHNEASVIRRCLASVTIDTPENRAEVLARFATARRKDLEKGHPGHPGVRTTREVADYFSWPTARAKRLLEAMHDDGDIVGWAPCPPDGCTWAVQ